MNLLQTKTKPWPYSDFHSFLPILTCMVLFIGLAACLFGGEDGEDGERGAPAEAPAEATAPAVAVLTEGASLFIFLVLFFIFCLKKFGSSGYVCPRPTEGLLDK